jgi:hypothetical protein
MNSNLRDNVHKHKKEKDVDRYLMKQENLRAKELLKKTKEIENIVEVKLMQKRKRQDDGDGEAKEEKIEDSSQEIDVITAIEKILKHVERPNSFIKCINLLKSLFLNLSVIPDYLIVKIFYKLSTLPFRFSTNEQKIAGVELFKFTNSEKKRVYIVIDENMHEKKNTNYVLEFLELFSIIFETEAELKTDDSFKFNTLLKKIELIFDDLPLYDYEEETELIKFRENLANFSSENLESFSKESLLYLSLKRVFIFSCYVECMNNISYKWAHTAVSNLFRKSYYEKEKLSPPMISNLESMLSSLRSQSSQFCSQSRTNQSQEANIKSTPLESSHTVVDSREVRLIEINPTDQWGSKQAGLTSSKLSFNK